SNATRSPSKARTWPPTTGSGSTVLFFFSSRRRHTRWPRDWSSDVCSSDLPYVRQPEELVPGKPLFYASAVPFSGYGVGVLVESREGRPIKIEGNPDHPESLGSTNSYMQRSEERRVGKECRSGGSLKDINQK